MNISELSLRRPVLAVVLNVLIVVFGLIGFKFLGVRDYPAIDPPNVSVRASYAAANADIIESQITEPLEKAINGIAIATAVEAFCVPRTEMAASVNPIKSAPESPKKIEAGLKL